MTIGKNIRALRRQHGWSQDHLAELLGYKSYTTIQKWESNASQPPVRTLKKLAQLFGVSITELTERDLTTDGEKIIEFPDGSTAGIDKERLLEQAFGLEEGSLNTYIPTKKIPILGRISAGLPLYAEENIEGYTYTDLNGGAEYFALRVTGDSMTAARIFEGDVLIIRRQETVENGEIAVVMVDDDAATVKFFHQHGDQVILEPRSFNPEHSAQVYHLKDTRIRVLGKVVQSQIAF